MVWLFCRTRIDERKRLFRGSFDRQTSQSQHREGTPVEVPVPKNRISIKIYFPPTRRRRAAGGYWARTR